MQELKSLSTIEQGGSKK